MELSQLLMPELEKVLCRIFNSLGSRSLPTHLTRHISDLFSNLADSQDALNAMFFPRRPRGLSLNNHPRGLSREIHPRPRVLYLERYTHT